MEIHNPDDQLQALRQWLNDNGPALLGGLLLGTVLIAGWKGWQFYTDRQSRQASVQFEQLRATFRGGDPKSAQAIVQRLTEDYARTPYAALAALTLAAEQVRQGKHDVALTNYAWVVEEAPDRKLRHVARLRRARLLWSLGKAEEALAELQTRRPDSFAPLFAELRGDILAGQARRDEARQAYSEALAAEPAAEQRAGIELKLNDLGGNGPASATTAVPEPKGG